ncbi:MAG: J domain-containing protein [Acidimicrobiia bacterium]|nr:J domain-containing protein [Acidimicrobiia bacterium]
MVLAEMEVVHSRPIAPTRRVALGELHLPTEPAPGFGIILLGGVMAANIEAVDPDLHDGLSRLMAEVERGRRISQPRLRHRFQADHIGLQRSTHRLHGRGERLVLDVEDRGAPVPQVLGAVYAVATLPLEVRPAAMDVVRRGMRWRGDVGDRLIAHLSGYAAWKGLPAAADPFVWALGVFGVDDTEWSADRRAVQQRFRDLLRTAHPDHGGETDAAALRIAELAEARRILLA